MYKRLLIFTFCVIGLTVLLGLLPIHGESEIYEGVVRLHVLANSDTEEDQALKLKVRDAVLEHTGSLLRDVRSREEAQSIIESELDSVCDTAQRAVYANGYGYPVSVSLGREDYPTRSYETVCLPSGEYLSLRILIGEAEGKNWWCVLFPPMCLSAASQSSEAFAQVGLTGDQYSIITQTDTPKYKIRFKLLEVLERTVN